MKTIIEILKEINSFKKNRKRLFETVVSNENCMQLSCNSGNFTLIANSKLNGLFKIDNVIEYGAEATDERETNLTMYAYSNITKKYNIKLENSTILEYLDIDNLRYPLKNLSIQEGKLYTSDAHALYGIATEFKDLNINISYLPLFLMKKLKVKECYVSSNDTRYSVFFLYKGIGIEFNAHLECAYPVIKNFFKTKDFKPLNSINVDTLKEISKFNKTNYLFFGNNKITAKDKDVLKGSVEYKADLSEYKNSFCIQNRFFNPFIKQALKDKVKFINVFIKGNTMLFTYDNVEFFINRCIYNA